MWTDTVMNQVTVFFDDAKVTYDDIEEALTKHDMTPTGEPEYLK